MSDIPESLSLDLLLPVHFEIERKASAVSTEAEVTSLFQEFRVRIVRYLVCLGLSIQDGEEIAQEVFLLLFQHLRLGKPRQNLRGWIFRVAHNLGLRKRIESRSRGEANEGWQSPCVQVHDPGPSPEEQVAFKQQQKRLLAILDALPAQDRACFYLRAEGLQYREIAHVLEMSLGSVSQSLARVVKRLSHVYHR